MKPIYLMVLSILMACNSPTSLEILEIKNPSIAESGSLSFHKSQDGTILLSWIEEQDSLAQLKYAEFSNSSFTDPVLISKGYDWFVNWADFPGMAVFSNDTKVAHWLQMSGNGTYDYDVQYRIQNKMEKWSDATVLHQDGISAEHGFVSMEAHDEQVLAIWLDGRHTKTGDEAVMEDSKHEHEEKHAHGQGTMTLRSALISNEGAVSHRLEIDHSVCDCCQTDLAMSSCGMIAVYRDRSHDEIRDIYFSTFNEDQWSEPLPVSVDDWKINGCPVNGPSVAAIDAQITVAWYTEAEKTRSIKLTRSTSCTPDFQTPLVIASGDSIMGRVDLIMDHQYNAILTWMAESDSGANLHITKVDKSGKIILDQVIAKMSKSRRSGFPRLAQIKKGKYLVAFRDHSGSKHLKTQIITEL